MWLLAQILTELTRHPRQKVVVGRDFTWSQECWVHNIFRVYELIFWRRAGIRPDGFSSSWGEQYSYTWENLFAVYEGLFRAWIKQKVPKFKIVYIPQLQLAGLARGGISPFRFAIALDTSAISTEVNNTGQSWSHTQTGSNLIIIAYDVLESTTLDQYTNMTYNSGAMTVGNSQASTNRFCKMWYLTGAATGAHTVQPTNTSQFNQGASASYTGVNQAAIDNTSPFQVTTTTTFTCSITPNTAGNTCWVISGFVSDQALITANTNVVARQTGGAPMAIGDSNTTVTSSGWTMTWNIQNASHVGGVIASFAPVAAVAATSPKLSILGVS